jgi:hypothetical protein
MSGVFWISYTISTAEAVKSFCFKGDLIPHSNFGVGFGL